MFATDSQINMKKILLALFILTTSNIKAQPKKILFVGNSYVYTNNLPLVLYNLALSNGDTIIYDSSAPGGYTFLQHTTNATTLSKINAQAWDYVVLQEQSQKPAFSPSQVQAETFPYAAQLNDLILANDSCTQTVFFMTWGRKYGDATNCAIYPPLCTFEGMQGRLRQSYVEMADDNEALVSPVGEAFKYSRMADSTINLYTVDNSHPSVAGTYLAACTFYATLFETSPVGLSYTAGLDATQAAFLQQIAYQTVFDSLSVWNINEFEPQASFNIASVGSSIYQYQFTNTGINANNFSWNFGDGTSSTIINPVHTFSGNGTYTITLTASDGCESDTFQETINIGPLSTIQELNNNEINVILQDQLISITQNQSNLNFLQITVFDVLGKVIYQNLNSNQTLLVNTATWNKGLYFVQCSNNKQAVTKKIIVE
jgi:PKD repeat protein